MDDGLSTRFLVGVRIVGVLDVASWERLLLGVIHRHTNLKLVEVRRLPCRTTARPIAGLVGAALQGLSLYLVRWVPLEPEQFHDGHFQGIRDRLDVLQRWVSNPALDPGDIGDVKAGPVHRLLLSDSQAVA